MCSPTLLAYIVPCRGETTEISCSVVSSPLSVDHPSSMEEDLREWKSSFGICDAAHCALLGILLKYSSAVAQNVGITSDCWPMPTEMLHKDRALEHEQQCSTGQHADRATPTRTCGIPAMTLREGQIPVEERAHSPSMEIDIDELQREFTTSNHTVSGLDTGAIRTITPPVELSDDTSTVKRHMRDLNPSFNRLSRVDSVAVGMNMSDLERSNHQLGTMDDENFLHHDTSALLPLQQLDSITNDAGAWTGESNRQYLLRQFDFICDRHPTPAVSSAFSGVPRLSFDVGDNISPVHSTILPRTFCNTGSASDGYAAEQHGNAVHDCALCSPYISTSALGEMGDHDQTRLCRSNGKATPIASTPHRTTIAAPKRITVVSANITKPKHRSRRLRKCFRCWLKKRKVQLVHQSKIRRLTRD